MGMGKALWEFISMVYELYWNALYIDNNNMSLRNKISLKFISQVKNILAPGKSKDVAKPTFVSFIPPPILAKMSKEVREISKFFKKIDNSALKKSYAQVSISKQNSSVTSSNIMMNTLKIKKMFSNLPNKKIDSIQKVINSSNDKLKPRFNMTTKGPSCKQVIIPMSNDLGKRFTKDLSFYIININCALKSIKSNTCADFIYADNKGVIISTNNVASNSNLHEIEKYIKNLLSANNDSIAPPRLSQSKSYLKIVGIPYFIDKSNTYVTSKNIKHILKNNHIFNDIVLASKPCIIKVSPKLNMVIVWIDIWNIQNNHNTKKIINRCFNIRNIVAMVRGANMNPGIPQCKNCWKWGHSTGVCHIQGSKYAKCNSPYLTDKHCDFT